MSYATKVENKTKLWNMLVAERGEKCEMCGRALTGFQDGVLHHRHYRTVDKNFTIIGKLQGDEFSILCAPCHSGLHYRHSNRTLTKKDWGFVDPQWKKSYYEKRLNGK